MGLFSKKTRSAGDDESFVRLIQVAEEFPEIREQMIRILSLDPFNRKSALNSFIREMQTKGAPEKFVSAMTCFLDDQVAEKALGMLGKENNSG